MFSYGDPLRSRYDLRNQDGFFRGHYEKWMQPYEAKFVAITSSFGGPDLLYGPGSSDAYAFTGYSSSSGVQNLVYSHIPIVPIGNLGELRDARLGGGAAYYRRMGTTKTGIMATPIDTTGYDSNPIPRGITVVQDAFGNSWGHPAVDVDKVSANFTVTQYGKANGATAFERPYDFSWIMNQDIWDARISSAPSLEAPLGLRQRLAAHPPKISPPHSQGFYRREFTRRFPIRAVITLLVEYGSQASTLSSSWISGNGVTSEAVCAPLPECLRREVLRPLKSRS